MTQVAQTTVAHAHTIASHHHTSVGADAPGLTCLGGDITTTFVAETQLPTADGVLCVRAYRSTGSLRSSEPIAIVSGNVAGQRNVAVRVHDQCFTSEVFGSLKCDCREQLAFAKAYIRTHGGVVVYMPQEGRGIGLANKIHAYALQETGVDTVDANRALGFADDYRTYEPVVDILRDLGVQSVQLLTNNPRKIRLLRQLGVQVDGRLPVVIPSGEHSAAYLAAKAQRMAHLLPDDTDAIKPVAGTVEVDVEDGDGDVEGGRTSQLDDSEDDTLTDESSQDEDELLLPLTPPLASPTSSSMALSSLAVAFEEL